MVLRCISGVESFLSHPPLPPQPLPTSCPIEEYFRCKLNMPRGLLFMKCLIGLRTGGRLDTADRLSGSPCNSSPLSCSLPMLLVRRNWMPAGPPDGSWPRGCHGRGKPPRCHWGLVSGSLWARAPGDTQWDRNLPECLLSQVFEGEGMRRQEKKSAEGRSWCRVTVRLGKANERQWGDLRMALRRSD